MTGRKWVRNNWTRKENGIRTAKIRSVADSLDGGQKGLQELGRITNARNVSLSASARTKSSNGGRELRRGSQSMKSLLYTVQLTHGAGGNLREVDLSAD